MAELLSEMTWDELWELSPIILSGHKECWNDWYIEEMRIKGFLPPTDVPINHIGGSR